MDAERLFTETKQGFGFYHNNFGVPYAFGKYDQLFVPEFNAGAMENAGAVTFLEDYVFRSKVTRASYERRAETVLHEMAHMWFGDLVTMEWWDDLWLNESFATFASVLCQAEATEYTEAWTTFANVEKSWAYRQDQLPSTHPVAADIPDLAAVEVNFDGITYAKGASVLKQLVAYVGLEEFLAGLRDYFRDHAFGNATFGDLLGALEKASGPRPVRLGAAVAEDHRAQHVARRLRPRRRRTVHPLRDHPERCGSPAPARPGCTGWRSASTTTTAPASWCGCTARNSTSRVDVTEVPALQGVPRGKLILVNDDDLTYCSLRLDPDSLQTVLTRIADIAEPLPRTLAWSAAWEMTREAELKARDFVALVAAGCTPRPRSVWCSGCCCRPRPRSSSYADPDWAARGGLAGLRRPAAGAGPRRRGRLRTTSWRSSTRCARRCCRRGTPRCWRELLDADPAELGLAGLAVDTDLRWRIVTALAAAARSTPTGPQHAVHRRRGRSVTRPPRASVTPRQARRPARRPRSRKRPGSRSSRTTRWPTSPPASIIGGFVQPGRTSCCSRSGHATSTRSPRCGSGAPARSRRRSWSGCTRRGTSARPAWTPPTSSWRPGGAARAAPPGARGPRGSRARAAGARVRRH